MSYNTGDKIYAATLPDGTYSGSWSAATKKGTIIATFNVFLGHIHLWAYCYSLLQSCTIYVDYVSGDNSISNKLSASGFDGQKTLDFDLGPGKYQIRVDISGDSTSVGYTINRSNRCTRISGHKLRRISADMSKYVDPLNPSIVHIAGEGEISAETINNGLVCTY